MIRKVAETMNALSRVVSQFSSLGGGSPDHRSIRTSG
jgi:hypothetical protein